MPGAGEGLSAQKRPSPVFVALSKSATKALKIKLPGPPPRLVVTKHNDHANVVMILKRQPVVTASYTNRLMISFYTCLAARRLGLKRSRTGSKSTMSVRTKLMRRKTTT